MQSQGCKALLGALITEPPPRRASRTLAGESPLLGTLITEPPPQCLSGLWLGSPPCGAGQGADRSDPGHLHFLPFRLALVLPPPPARPSFPEQGLEAPFCGDRNTSQGPRSDKKVDCELWDRVEKARALPLSPAGPLEAPRLVHILFPVFSELRTNLSHATPHPPDTAARVRPL